MLESLLDTDLVMQFFLSVLKFKLLKIILTLQNVKSY